jgi:DNA-binding NarL/FixJ family response regulator
MINILVADSHPLIRESLRLVIKELDQPFTIFEAGDYADAADLLAHIPELDLAIIDFDLPTTDGSLALEHLLQQTSTIPIVVLTTKAELSDVKHILKAGALGVIPKNESRPAIVEALRSVLAGNIYVPRQFDAMAI